MAPQKEISYNLPAFPSHFPPYLDKYDVETCRILMKREFRKIVAARMRSNKSVRLNAVPQVAIKSVAGGEFGPCNGQTCIGIDYVLMETQFSPVLVLMADELLYLPFPSFFLKVLFYFLF
ncbi:hypothetical protein P3S68_015593 [Capsicum galapagoense]